MPKIRENLLILQISTAGSWLVGICSTIFENAISQKESDQKFLTRYNKERRMTQENKNPEFLHTFPGRNWRTHFRARHIFFTFMRHDLRTNFRVRDRRENEDLKTELLRVCNTGCTYIKEKEEWKVIINRIFTF